MNYSREVVSENSELAGMVSEPYQPGLTAQLAPSLCGCKTQSLLALDRGLQEEANKGASIAFFCSPGNLAKSPWETLTIELCFSRSGNMEVLTSSYHGKCIFRCTCL